MYVCAYVAILYVSIASNALLIHITPCMYELSIQPLTIYVFTCMQQYTFNIFYYNGDNNNYYGTGWHKILMKHDLMKMWWIKQKINYDNQAITNKLLKLITTIYVAIVQLSSWNETII